MKPIADEFYRQLFEHATDGIFITDDQGRCLDVNASGARLLGMSVEELVGRPATELLQASEHVRLEPALERLRAGETLCEEWRLQRKDGSVFTGEVSSTRLPDGRLQGILRDISNRKLTEHTLKQSEARFRALTDAAFEGIGMSEKGEIVDVNDQLARMLGYARDELVGRPVSDLATAESRLRVAQAMQAGFEGPYEHHVLRRDGSSFLAEVRAKAAEIDGRKLRVTAIRDISERRRMEDALRGSEERLRATIEGTPYVAVQWYDAQGRVRLWNRASEQMFGWPAEEALGKTLDQLIQTEAEAELFRRLLVEIDQTGQPAGPSEFRFRRRDGSEGYCLSTTFKIPSSGAEPQFACMDVEVTVQKRITAALRESAERYRLLVENSSDLVCEVDAADRMRYVSPRFESVLGYAAHALLGRGLFDHVHDEDRARARAELGGDQAASTFRYRHVNGHCLWLDVTRRDYQAQSGERRSVLIARDVTERREQERQRQELEQQLRQTQKLEALGTLAGGIAHDFNNVLGAIFAYSELAAVDAGRPERVRSRLGELDKAAGRARDLVQQILAFSRGQREERRPSALAPLADEALRFLRSTLPATIAIECRIDPRTPLVLAAPVQIHQVIMNLCTNAAHAMRGRAGRLRLSLEGVQLDGHALLDLPELQPGRYARLTVEDTGHGMDAPTLKRIFEPFFTTKGAGEGSGLGLAVTQGIVREHQGALRAVSEPGRGATFSVYLPAHEWTTQEVSDDLQALPRASGERILFVDDERALCESSKLVLENIGYEVTAYDDPLSALREFSLRPQAFDLVVTDLTMPGMTGVELARNLLQIRAELPVLLASGYGGGFTVEQVRAMGLRDMLSKPLTPKALSAAVQKTLAR